MSDDFLTRLRETTAEMHQSLEDEMPLMEPDIDRATYTAYLERLLGFYEPLEAELDAHPPVPDWPERRKSPLLARDLQALGLTETEIAALPRCDRLPEVTDTPAALGCGYVMEGATLGGRLIRRHLARSWGISEEAPELGFFSVYGDAGGDRWRRYREALTAAAREGSEVEDKMIAAALGTFRDLRGWLRTDYRLSRSTGP